MSHSAYDTGQVAAHLSLWSSWKHIAVLQVKGPHTLQRCSDESIEDLLLQLLVQLLLLLQLALTQFGRWVIWRDAAQQAGPQMDVERPGR